MAAEVEKQDRRFNHGGDNNRRHKYRRRTDHVLTRLDKLEEKLPEVDVLKAAVDENTKLTRENTAITMKAAADSAQSLALAKKIAKDTGTFVAVIKAGQKTGQVTIKGAGWIRKALIWVTPIIIGVTAFISFLFTLNPKK